MQAVATLTSLLPRGWIEETARAVGRLRRRSKVSPFALLWTVVVGSQHASAAINPTARMQAMMARRRGLPTEPQSHQK